jgi:signal transduction histidine kinase
VIAVRRVGPLFDAAIATAIDAALAAAGVAAAAVPVALDGGPRGPGEWVGTVCMAIGAALVAGWRRFPLAALAIGPALLLVPLFVGPDPSNFVLLALLVYSALLAERFSGRAAWLAAAAYVGYLAVLYALTGDDSPGLIVLTLPGFVAGTALRLRRQTAEELAERGRELDDERKLFASLAVRNERARIASELHDIVGHALSVMVVQAAAGQRLTGPAATESLAAIASSARQGQADLRRLLDLLAGTEVTSPDLTLIDDIVDQAARTGLRVTCHLEGSRDGLHSDVAHAAVRVVQESLTNALRHAPGAEVRVRLAAHQRSLTVRVENSPPPAQARPPLPGSGRGLIGLRERVSALGGTFTARPTPDGGWEVSAYLPSPSTPQGSV